MDVVSALFAGGDTVAAARAAVAGSTPEAASGRDDPTLYQVCAAGLWLADRRDFSRAARLAARLDGGTNGRPPDASSVVCAATIEALAASGTSRADAGQRLATLDSLARAYPVVTSWIITPANLVVARLSERRGQPATALAAVRRRSYIADLYEHRILVALPAMLRAEGRLAAATGDTTGAIAAYRHYLALMAQPEPALRAQADSVRRALGALGAGRPRP
jgi:hypothetical protein